MDGGARRTPRKSLSLVDKVATRYGLASVPGRPAKLAHAQGQRMSTNPSYIPVEARIFRDKKLLGTWRIMYLGLLGTVLDADAVELPIGLDLELELELQGEGRRPICRLDAVVNQHRLGVGLTFRDPGKQSCNQLQEMIFESWRFAAPKRRTRSGRRPTAIAWRADHALPKPG